MRALQILLVSSPEKGHLHPMIGVAQHLRHRGHRVAWLGLPHSADGLRDLGVEPVSLAEELPAGRATRPLLDLVRDPSALREWVTELLLGSVEAWIPPVMEAMKAVAPDVVALDPMQYAAIIAAQRLRLPYAGISSSLNPVTPLDWECELTRTVAALARAREELFARNGLRPRFRVCDALSPYLNVVFSTAEYAGAELPPQTHLVGPSRPIGARGDEPSFPWERLDPARPLIYVSFGSQIGWQPTAFAKVGSAARELGAQLVINAGVQRAEGWGAIVVPYAPQLKLLERAAVMVSHGGANSVMEAHNAGVPLLLSPVCNDQHLQARFLERSRAGRVLDLERASISETTEALAVLLSAESPHRAALMPITASYQARDGAKETAERIIALGS